ncbi:MAG TPA: transposase [Chloroflexota bacterium]|nr:transposase [Chloroflexota bacterium]
MTTVDFITELFCRIDEAMREVPKHPQAHLYPSEVVTLALLFALKGGGERAFYRWLARDYRPLFPRVPERTRLFRLFATHQDWTQRFLAQPTVLGVADSYGVELLHPYREKRRPLPERIGRKGLSNHRWIVGGKLAVVLNQWGLVCGWAAETATVHDSAFQPLIARFATQMVVLADENFARREGNPPTLKVCPRGTWNDRMLVETTFSMLTLICHAKKAIHRAWSSFTMRLAFSVALFNVLVQWDGLSFDEDGCVHRSIAQFSL